jgi:hypothetical protein
VRRSDDGQTKKKRGIATIGDAPGFCGRPGSPATHGSLP